MKKLYVKKKECCGCGACVDVCRKDAVRMVIDREGFRYPKIDGGLCVDCGRCEDVCPIKKQSPKKEASRQYFAVQAKDENVRYASSSGGMFPILAEYVFRQQGVVYGAAYDKNMRVVHREICGREELDSVKRTKYVQSSMKGIYRKIETQLKKEQWVLFCGTPCQAEGLRLYLKQPYPKLILADLVCYGVPSPGIWGDYVKHLEGKRGGKMTDFSFRDKRMRDSGHTCAYVIDGQEYSGSLYADEYCRMYFTNHILRPSCHDCKFCTVERNSDITIGDFWGIEKVKPEIDDGMGTSLVILHTEKAREIWEAVRDEVSWFACEERDVIQPRLTDPTEAAKSRGLFMASYRMLSFSQLLRFHKALASGRALLKKLKK